RPRAQQRADWIGIHAKICDELAVLRKPLRMIVITRTTGQKLLFENHFEEAVPAALQSLKFAIDVHGSSSVELVPSYLILGEASIGLQRLSQAEDGLCAETDNPSNAIKSQLAQKSRTAVLRLKAITDTRPPWRTSQLISSMPQTNTAQRTSACPVATSAWRIFSCTRTSRRLPMTCLDGVIDIWYDHLWRIVQAMTAPPDIPDGLGEVVAEITQEEKEHLDEAQQAEALKILHSIYSLLWRPQRQSIAAPRPSLLAKFDSKTAELLAAAGLGDSHTVRRGCDRYR
uniref:Sec23_trunk domain-containing protein n=1 Tax=Macrostomum lignano TaxID=282301 RepID=A0A1I8F337_9PLAT